MGKRRPDTFTSRVFGCFPVKGDVILYHAYFTVNSCDLLLYCKYKCVHENSRGGSPGSGCSIGICSPGRCTQMGNLAEATMHALFVAFPAWQTQGAA